MYEKERGPAGRKPEKRVISGPQWRKAEACFGSKTRFQKGFAADLQQSWLPLCSGAKNI
jgi:hypothetical protein